MEVTVSSRNIRLAITLTLVAGVLASCSSGGDGSFVDRVTTTGGESPTTAAASTTTSTTEPIDPGVIDAVLPAAGSLIESAEYGVAPANLIAVVLAAGGTDADAEAVAAAVGGAIVGQIELIGLYQIETNGVTEDDLRSALETARSRPEVESAFADTELYTKDLTCQSGAIMNETSYTEGTNARPYEMIGLEDAWDIVRASGVSLGNVHVGVMDSKLNNFSSEIGGGPKLGGASAADTTDDPETDKNGDIDDGGLSHGTQVTHTIGADPDNGGVAGVASVLGGKLKVTVKDIFTGPSFTELPDAADPNDPSQITYHGKAYTVNTLAGMLNQIKNGATVINCSFGPKEPDAKYSWKAGLYEKFLDEVHKKYPGVVFVAAAGNEGDKNVALNGANYYPGGIKAPNLITVGALNQTGDRASFSNFSGAGGEVTLAAPGTDVPTGVGIDGKTVTSSGTSFATPMVAGTVALLQSINPKLTATQIKQILVESAYAGAPAREGDATSTLVPENVGGGILRVDEAVIRVINDLRADADPPQDPLDKDTLLALANVTGTAAPMGAFDFDVTATVDAVRPEGGTALTIDLLGEGFVDGDSQVALESAGSASWQVSWLEGSDSPTVRVCRTDVNACCTMYLETIDIVGTWDGTLAITDAEVAEDIVIDTCFLGEEDCEPTVITKEECEQQLVAAEEGAIPIVLIFTGTETSGEVSLQITDADNETETLGPTSWSLTTAGVSFSVFDPESPEQGGMSFTGNVSVAGDQGVLSGSWTFFGIDNLAMSGDFRVTRPLQPPG
jgi:hypothetical protein